MGDDSSQYLVIERDGTAISHLALQREGVTPIAVWELGHAGYRLGRAAEMQATTQWSSHKKTVPEDGFSRQVASN